MNRHLVWKFFIFVSLCIPSIVQATPVVFEIHGVEVLPTKISGDTWDVGFGDMVKPDLQIRFSQSTKAVWMSPKMMNTHSYFGVFSSTQLDLDLEQALVIDVLDLDLRNTDLVESFQITLSELPTSEHKTIVLSGKSVLRLKIMIKVSKVDSKSLK